MKKIYFIILLVTICLSANSQPITLEDYSLKGKVKTITQTVYNIMKDSDQIIKGEIVNCKVNFNENYMAQFNKNGQLTNRATYIFGFKFDSLTFNLGGGDLVVKKLETYTYDDSDFLIETISLSYNDSLKGKFVNDHYGNPIIEYWYLIDETLDQKIVNNYQDFDKISDQSFYYPDGTLSYNSIYSYNSNDKIKSVFNIRPSGDTIKKYLFKYDSDDFLIQQEIFTRKNGWYTLSAKGDTVANVPTRFKYEKYLFWYNERGLISDQIIQEESESYLPDKKPIKKQKRFIFTHSQNKYEFDKEGNWIQKIISIENKPTYIVERKIKYY